MDETIGFYLILHIRIIVLRELVSVVNKHHVVYEILSYLYDVFINRSNHLERLDGKFLEDRTELEQCWFGESKFSPPCIIAGIITDLNSKCIVFDKRESIKGR